MDQAFHNVVHHTHDSSILSSLFQNVQLQEENLSLKQHTTNLTTEKQQLEQRLAESAQTDVLRSLIKESLLESPVGSAVPRVSPQQKQLLKALLVRVWMTFR